MMSPYQILHVVSESYLRGEGFGALEVVDVLGLRHIGDPEDVLGLGRVEVVEGVRLKLVVEGLVMLVLDPAAFKELLTHVVVVADDGEDLGVFGEGTIGEEFVNGS
jgi:hypothetical protein